MSEEVLSRRPVYEGDMIDFEVVRIRTANGHESERALVHHPGAVAVVALERATNRIPQGWQLLLTSQFRLAAGRTLLEIPAGTREPDEPPLETARRELAEETRREAQSWHELARFYASPGYTDEELILYLALDLAPCEGEPDPGEQIGISSMPLTLAYEEIKNGRIRDAKTIAGVLLALDWIQANQP